MILRSVRGMLAKYADPKLREQEDSAWEKAMQEKFDDTSKEASCFEKAQPFVSDAVRL